MAGQTAYGLLMEQGTGKTWCLLADAERLFAAGKIDCLCVVAPRGVHTNWVRREIPTHFDCPHIAYAWDGKSTQRADKERAKLFALPENGKQRKLRILTINFDAIIHNRGFDFARSFIRSGKCLLVLDECFLAGTLVSTPTGPRAIETLKAGEIVLSSAGAKIIKRVLKGKTNRYNVVKLEDGRTIMCTENHPFFTEVGWVCANSLKGHRLVNETNLRVVQETTPDRSPQSILRKILLSEVENATAGDSSSRLYGRAIGESLGGIDGALQRPNAMEQREGNDDANAPESFGGDAGNRASAIRSRRQRASHAESASASFTNLRTAVANGTGHSVGQTATKLSNLLQSRCRAREEEMGDRSGWPFAHRDFEKRTGQEKGCEISSSRVVDIEIVECDDSVATFDLQIESTPHYFVEGFLVHNSSRIKSPPKKAARTAASLLLGKDAPVRRIATGTPITNAPEDAFYQFEFLESGLLGTTSYRAFVAEYTRLLDAGHPLMRNIIAQNPRAQWAQIPERDAVTGRPIYQNLDKLQDLIERHSYRVLKKDCLDLPPKVYKTIYFELTSKQEAAYRLMEKKFRMELDNGEIDTVAKLNAITKLQQITSGFLIGNDRAPFYVEKEGLPRLDALLEAVEDIDGPIIVWASFREELAHIGAALRKAGRKVVEYHGATPVADREKAVDDFQSGKADVFLGHPAAGGIGITLTAANHAIYYSNSYNMETRVQSEDRCHRIGTTGTKVTYLDILAQGSIDEVVYDALQGKKNLAATILNDFSCPDRTRGAF